MDRQGQNGLLSTFREGWRSRQASAWLIAGLLIGFYLWLYFEDRGWFPESMKLMDPAAQAVGLRNRWFLYGFLYCLAMVGGAVYYLRRHGNSRYNQIRIAVNLLVQTLLAFTLPFVMYVFTNQDFYASYLWPLKIEYLYPQTLEHYPVYIAIYCVLAALVATPILALTLGKRWYCSWVCGCGGLANTFGDPWRHLTSSSTRSWRFEKVTVHTVLVLAVSLTVLVAVDFFWGASLPRYHSVVGELRSLYGLFVGAILAGVVGVGLYPLFGPRVWCRNFCPMAALLGLTQKLGRFRIAVKPDMCISCGNCTTYCEMGIDVRAYAQENESFTRAACVGCGMCAHVCPRGVLKLENAPKGKSLPVVG
ncbi:MAG: 4Fe-4S ferredoxin [Sandaracinus sp.]|nr:4Fe-4S ferredoxin [Sandaracinus sp.]|tara:strand:+ start:534 stop:1622 length:1089 start_codon:yes stop_codon:yes gene_type:complete